MAGRLVSGRKTALCALVSLLCCPAAWAVSPGDQDLIRDRQDRLLEEQQRRLEELRNLPGKAAEPGEAQPA
ncbi:ShlB/FhaC/HecB family hemolysin secretion/activation protein, partial [Pseudomonas mosselii]|nr:ShlB/FhaC/HecB family hemolysin secretion/activation protein [Pseudomonas mosselii]